MQLDKVTAEIRPRSDWEAVDLGFAMVRRDFWRCVTVWWLALLVPTVVAGWLLWNHPTIWLMLFWWWKPAGSRMVLYQLSRRLFGEQPSWRAVFRELPRAWWRRFFHRFFWARLSPWLPVTLAVADLEGLRGKAYRQRCLQIARRGSSAVMWMFFSADFAACWFAMAILGMVKMLIPDGQDSFWQHAIDSWDPSEPMELPMLIVRVVAICSMISISLVDVFVSGAGFAIYVNNRTWLEGWDVELAFKRLAQRLGKIALVIAALLWMGMPGAVAQETRAPAEVIREVKSAPEFHVNVLKERIPQWDLNWKWNWNWNSSGGHFFGSFAQVLPYLVLSLFLILLAWLVWKFRHVFVFRGGGVKSEKPAPAARVVMGMEVTPQSLPPDIPAAAWELWAAGHHQQALGLLYRGAISKVIQIGHVEIQESDTEGDCMRRVDAAGATNHPDFFQAVTHAWQRMAYAGVPPQDDAVLVLCERWPYASSNDRRDK